MGIQESNSMQTVSRPPLYRIQSDKEFEMCATGFALCVVGVLLCAYGEGGSVGRGPLDSCDFVESHLLSLTLIPPHTNRANPRLVRKMASESRSVEHQAQRANKVREERKAKKKK